MIFIYTEVNRGNLREFMLVDTRSEISFIINFLQDCGSSWDYKKWAI